MANRKYGGREWSPSDDFPLKRGDSDQWNAKSSGQDERWDDDTGVKRGEQSRAGTQAHQSRGGDDSAFLTPSQSQTYEQADGAIVHERLGRLIDNQKDQPAGPMLGGGGPVSDNLERKDSHRRYVLGKGRLRDSDDGGL